MNDGPMTKDAHRWGPLTGVLFVAVAVKPFVAGVIDIVLPDESV